MKGALPSTDALTAATQRLALDAQLCFPIYAAANLLTRAYRPLLEPLGLTYPQYLVMLALWEVDGVTVGALGDRLALDSGTLSPLLRRLEARRLVRKRAEPHDARRVVVTLTVRGRALRAAAAHVPEALWCRARAQGDDAAHLVALREQLKGLVTRLRHELDGIQVPDADASPPEGA